MVHSYKSVFISDVHLGTAASQATKLLKFLKSFNCENLFLVGDIIDGWAMQGKVYWPTSHNDVVQQLLKMAKSGVKIYYIPGNHDEVIRPFIGEGLHFGNIIFTTEYTYAYEPEGPNTKKTYLITHGDRFDVVIRKAKWLAHLGSWAYDVSIFFNTQFNKIRDIFGLPHWSLANYLKYKVKTAVNFIGDYEKVLKNYAEQQGVDGIICGHIHHPALQFGDIDYLNCGDWVENCSAIIEHENGEWELLKW